MSVITSIELVPPTTDSPRAGLVIERGDQHSTLWLGEAKYDDVYVATGERAGYKDDIPDLYTPEATSWVFPIWSLYQGHSGKHDFHYFYFDDERRLQAVDICPVDDSSIRVAGIETHPVFLPRASIFGIPVPKLREVLDDYLKGEITKVGRYIIYHDAGLLVSRCPKIPKAIESFTLISQEWFEQILQERQEEVSKTGSTEDFEPDDALPPDYF